MRAWAKEHPRRGFRPAYHDARDEGWQVNHKKFQRLWRQEGLRVPQRRRRKRHGTSTAPQVSADAPDHVWAADFQFDVTTDGRPIKTVSIIDEHTRECLGDMVERNITGEDPINELERIAADRGTYPAVLRWDNGPEFACAAMADWAASHLGLHFIPPGEPWRNGYVGGKSAPAPNLLHCGAWGACCIGASTKSADAARKTPPAQMTGHQTSPHRTPGPGEPPRERIRHAAMELYAERGQRGPTLRAVAERADVSPGLVQHHYKTTQRLMAEAEAWVFEQLIRIGGDAPPGETNLGVDPARYDAFLAANPVVVGYLRRRLLEGAGADWFTDAVRYRRDRLINDVPESADPAVTAAMVVLVDVAPVLLGPLLEHALDCDAGQLATRWRRVDTRLLGLPVAKTEQKGRPPSDRAPEERDGAHPPCGDAISQPVGELTSQSPVQSVSKTSRPGSSTAPWGRSRPQR
jgi:AcrR family transcriptional regulator